MQCAHEGCPYLVGVREEIGLVAQKQWLARLFVFLRIGGDVGMLGTEESKGGLCHAPVRANCVPVVGAG
ncbi:hypothetical protein [Hydrogenophaga sp. BPS33]|uniref:hypothetical protein n=1 Tax=Hydrogenophaga sp. BPS33 TaxID=2651974 RepID=UPI00131FA557|nr:hypothetical protein [Hydrogenophaga sp. BPS33]QHE86634.1 hypothetical protein F9K07_17885 [Hydrogenophaga sp. BPS33]